MVRFQCTSRFGGSRHLLHLHWLCDSLNLSCHLVGLIEPLQWLLKAASRRGGYLLRDLPLDRC